MTMLSGDWPSLGAPSPNIDSEGILEVWKGIFEVQSNFDDRPVRPVRETQWDLVFGVTASEVIRELKRSVDSSPGSDRL